LRYLAHVADKKPDPSVKLSRFIDLLRGKLHACNCIATGLKVSSEVPKPTADVQYFGICAHWKVVGDTLYFELYILISPEIGRSLTKKQRKPGICFLIY
jgi:hypothetical protein